MKLFKVIFIDYAITIVTVFPPLSPSTQHPPLTQAIPTPLFMSCLVHISSLATPCPILYFTPLWIFCKYQFVLLNPLISSSIPPYAPPHLKSRGIKYICVHQYNVILLIFSH